MNLTEHLLGGEYTFDINGLYWKVEVEYHFFAPERSRDFLLPAEVDLVSVKSQGVDITEALPKGLLDDIKQHFGHGRER